MPQTAAEVLNTTHAREEDRPQCICCFPLLPSQQNIDSAVSSKMLS